MIYYNIANNIKLHNNIKQSFLVILILNIIIFIALISYFMKKNLYKRLIFREFSF